MKVHKSAEEGSPEYERMKFLGVDGSSSKLNLVQGTTIEVMQTPQVQVLVQQREKGIGTRKMNWRTM